MNEPDIKSYPYFANLLSVISKEDGYECWLYNNFIQLNYPIYAEKDGARLDFYTSLLWETCPFVSYQKLIRLFVDKNWQDIVQFLVMSIDSGFYCRFVIDTYYVEAYDTYLNNHIVHDIFVYGFDIENKVFYVADNFKFGKYCHEIVSIDQIKNGYESIEKRNLYDWLNGVEMIRLQYKNKYYGFEHTYKIDLHLIKDQINDYLKAEVTALQWFRIPSEQWKEGKDIYGINIYGCLKKFLEDIKYGRMKKDMRPFCVLMEHKKIMVERIKYLRQEKHLLQIECLEEDFIEIYKDAQILNSLWIKFCITSDNKLLDSMMKRIDSINLMEEYVMELLIEELSKICNQKFLE